jgi:hypothetical protein
VLLGGAGGLVTGWLAGRSQGRLLQQRLLVTEHSLQQKVDREGQFAALQAQVTELTQELQQLRAHQQLFFPLSSLDLRSNAPTSILQLPPIEPQDAIDRLTAMQIQLEGYSKPKAGVDRVFDRLALFLGDHYSVLACFRLELKRALHTKTRVRFSFKNKCPEEIARCHQLVILMKDLSLAYNYSYSKEKKLLQADLSEREDIRRFFDGEWFERYVCYRLNQFFQAQGWQYQYLKNPRIRFPNGDRAELDLFWLVQGQPLWIECKTSKEYESFLKKYSDYRKRLGMAPSRSILMVLEASEDQAEHHSQFWELTIGTRESLIGLVHRALQDTVEAAASSAASSVTSLAASRESLPTL